VLFLELDNLEEPDEYRFDSAIIAAAMEPTVGFAFALTLVRFLELDDLEEEERGVGVLDLAFIVTAFLGAAAAFTFGAPFAAFFSRIAIFQFEPAMWLFGWSGPCSFGELEPEPTFHTP
jgi:hypothetical protein